MLVHMASWDLLCWQSCDLVGWHHVISASYHVISLHLQVSALYWDHNDHHPQFSGHHAFLTNGYSQLLNKLAEQIDVKLNCPVCHVSWSYDDNEVTLTDENGLKWTCNKV